MGRSSGKENTWPACSSKYVVKILAYSGCFRAKLLNSSRRREETKSSSMEAKILLTYDFNKIITCNSYDSTLINADNGFGRQRFHDLVKLKDTHVLGPINSTPSVQRT